MGSDSGRRADFSTETRELVARRAGFRCSFPGCGQLTVGPANKPCISVNVGHAAHIYSAATSGKGPRGTGGLTESDLKSLENAIWLCAHHANLIDKNQGEDYPADVLHSYKTLHETRMAHELAGIQTPFGWVDRVVVDSCPLFSDRFELRFAKLNLVIGGNAVGKTALCEWIAAHSDPTYLVRWDKTRVDWKRVSTEMHYNNPEPHCIGVDFLSPDYPTYKLDGKPTAVATGPVKVVFPTELDFREQETPDHLELVAKALNLHGYEVKALCNELSLNGDEFLKAWFEEDDDGRHMYVQVQSEDGTGRRYLPLLSSSERTRLLMQLGMMAANKLSVLGPTLLILDAGFCLLDTDWLRHCAEILASPTCRFQTVAVTLTRDIDFDAVEWTGWKIIRLEGKPPDAALTVGFGGSTQWQDQ